MKGPGPGHRYTPAVAQPLLLLSNDDGYHSEGIHVLADALEVEDDGEQVEREGQRPEELPEAHGEHEQERLREHDPGHHERERGFHGLSLGSA